MKTKQIPLIIMLIGGAASSLISVLTGVSSKIMLERLLITLVVFLVLGGVIKIIVDKNFKNILEPDEQEETEEISTEDGDIAPSEADLEQNVSEQSEEQTGALEQNPESVDDEWG
ncbi:hypothetical protein [Eubacterium oxidoreducens]|uniref:Uncharacterized protein n=1 Tax=Eubacterium oxidoreducens TaxID=1732 RepID=A0A1G6APM1_EUBOX|nr:hypothetical protein [Eubacterium oxidoreducens]SDB10299.1 hypothetical protein SAMN02910417_00811 [Eubacterium oxidoreducens]